MAVNVTDVPGQMLLSDAVMVTDGVGAGRTVIVIGALAAVAGEGQTAFEVMITVTTSPSFKVELLKVLLFVPTFVPFICH